MIITQEIYDSCKKLAFQKGYKLRRKQHKINFLYFELSNDEDVLKFDDFYEMFNYLKSKKDKKRKPESIDKFVNVSIFEL